MIRALQRLFVLRSIEGYDHPELVDEVFRKTWAHDPEPYWTLVAGIKTALDFGGGCGAHYRRARLQNREIRWAVVETPKMVDRARERETDRLRFFTEIGEAAAWLGSVDLMHCDGAVQYAPNPICKVRELCAIGAKVLYWDRLQWTHGYVKPERQCTYLGDNGPGAPSAPRARVYYTRTPVLLSDFIGAHRGYEVTMPRMDRFVFERPRHTLI